MKQIIYISVILLLMTGAAFTQDAKPVDGPPPSNPPQDARGNALRQLGLSPQQMQQIRRLNQARKPLMDEAQQRLRDANRALDDVIYADQVNEADVQARLKDLHVAQAEVARIRFMNELAVRRILTREQLVRFRDIRRRFEETRDNFQGRPLPNAIRPNVRNQSTDVKSYQPGPVPVRPTPAQKRPNF